MPRHATPQLSPAEKNRTAPRSIDFSFSSHDQDDLVLVPDFLAGNSWGLLVQPPGNEKPTSIRLGRREHEMAGPDATARFRRPWDKPPVPGQAQLCSGI